MILSPRRLSPEEFGDKLTRAGIEGHEFSDILPCGNGQMKITGWHAKNVRCTRHGGGITVRGTCVIAYQTSSGEIGESDVRLDYSRGPIETVQMGELKEELTKKFLP